MFSSIDQEIKKVLITSANPSEGKTFTAINLAITFVQNENKVILIDCDLRKGRIHQVFKVSNDKGLSNLLIDEQVQLSNYIQKTKILDLDVITMGTLPPNPSELLSSKKFAALLDVLEKKYDFIVLDSTPINKVSDALIISNKADAILLIATHSKTKHSDIQHAVKSINNVGGKLTGIIVNKKKISKNAYYGKYYRN